LEALSPVGAAPAFIGLTGNNDQIAAVAKAYWVYYSPAEHEQSGADLVNNPSLGTTRSTMVPSASITRTAIFSNETSCAT
jgi:cytochrome oxidase Cu insertion factor (SCO1/SenC/PrrC family)